MSTGEEQGQRLLGQALLLSQEMVSDDDDDAESLDSRMEEAVAAKFDKMVDELASVVQRHFDEAITHMVEDRLSELRASVIRTLTSSRRNEAHNLLDFRPSGDDCPQVVRRGGGLRRWPMAEFGG